MSSRILHRRCNRLFKGSYCLGDEAVYYLKRSSKTSVNTFQTTRYDIPEDSCLHIGRGKDLKIQQITCKVIV